ncbi:LysM peptidoglycan-binding domain-containing protein [Geobacter sp. DSM 9736]|uniref:LysM peptidoglycan-binding domain-containing protein n=1 Tax=Geobacter sp. DSM 9736 TaxID=1277350 RepID=UPI000B51270D|nr:LysM peptidoglycan-binding domain-containing protein [Geobacter sp. DSM 9736]SNB47549.1 LysM domain-containing protein [Geobacter sp. DSM 9736]
MKRVISSFAAGFAISLVSASYAAEGDYYLYAPRKADPAEVSAGETAVLVREIVIRKGDTLRAISLEQIGRAAYFPQILLFNDIRNPDLIYEGKALRVPVRKVAEKNELKRGGNGKKRGRQPARKGKAGPAIKERRAAGAEDILRRDQEQALFDRAAAAYRNGSCREVLPLLEQFLSKFPRSKHVPDAMFYRADCYLKLSQE